MSDIPQTSELCDIDEDEFAPYPPVFSPVAALPVHSQTLPLNLNDPFDVSTFSDNMYFDPSSIMFVDEELPSPPPTAAPGCSVCGLSKGSIAVLEPCSHPLCSACLTSALNIVGEKDMQCAVCKAKVDDFKIHKPGTFPQASPQKENVPEVDSQNIYDAYKESFGHPQGVVDDGFEDFLDRAQGASTPVAAVKSMHKSDEKAVLRIDNVPWVSRRSVSCEQLD